MPPNDQASVTDFLYLLTTGIYDWSIFERCSAPLYWLLPRYMAPHKLKEDLRIRQIVVLLIKPNMVLHDIKRMQIAIYTYVDSRISDRAT